MYGPSRGDARRREERSFDLPPLPDCLTQQAVEGELAAWDLWMAAGEMALARHQRRRPHALPNLSRLARLFHIASDLGRLACGLAPPPKKDRQIAAAKNERINP